MVFASLSCRVTKFWPLLSLPCPHPVFPVSGMWMRRGPSWVTGWRTTDQGWQSNKMDGAQLSDTEGLVLSAQLILSLCGLGSVPAFEPDPPDAHEVSAGGA